MYLTAPWHDKQSDPAPPPRVSAPPPKSASVPKSPTYTPCGEYYEDDDMPPPSQHASPSPCDDDDEDDMHHQAMVQTASTGFSVVGEARSEASWWQQNLRSSGSAAESWAQPIGSRSVKRSISGKHKAQPIGASAQPVAPRRRTGAGSSVSQNAWQIMTPPPPDTPQRRIPPGQCNPNNQKNGARRPRPRSVLLADQALRHSCFAFAVVVENVVRVVAAVPTNLTGVELAPAPIIGFDLVAFAQAAPRRAAAPGSAPIAP